MKRFYFAAALAALAFTACSTEESVQPAPESAPIHFKSVSSLDVVTRAATPEDFLLDFNTFVTNTAMDAAKLVKYTAATTSWAFADGVDVPVDRTGGTLVAWYPTDLSVTATKADGVKFTLTAQKDDATKDLIYQHQAVAAPTADNIAVVMEHAYAKLSFKAVKGEGYTVENPSLTAVKINNGIYATGALDMLTGTLTPDVAGAVATLSLAKTADVLDKALVVPMDSKPSIEITCTVDGKDYTTTIKDTDNNMPSLEAGTEYEITLHVVGQNAAFTSVKQVPWETTAVNGGNIF